MNCKKLYYGAITALAVAPLFSIHSFAETLTDEYNIPIESNYQEDNLLSESGDTLSSDITIDVGGNNSIIDDINNIGDVLSDGSNDDINDTIDIVINDRDIVDTDVSLSDELLEDSKKDDAKYVIDNDLYTELYNNDVILNSSIVNQLDNIDNKLELMSSYVAYSNYGTIPSNYLEYFKGYIYKLKPFEDYVIFRSTQYQYILAYGNINYSNYVFSGDTVNVIKIDISSSYQNQYTNVTSSIENDFKVTIPNTNNLVYTSIKDSPYASCISINDYYMRYTVYILIVGALVCTFLKIFPLKNTKHR